ncbi:MAG: Beta-ketoacyl synthase, partial [Caulobacteraceae bacterium]|nr:Beta-ketoacyl synthase [Caulobacteraceae bacterium]
GPSAALATWFKIRGINYSISSACATSAHCIGAGAEQILMGKQDIVFAGGCEELDWTLSVMFDAMGAMSTNFNDRPAVASRAYDADRDGFVIAGGGGVVVLEEYERAKARGAKIYAEITGYAANSDGWAMVAPSGEGAARCMRLAMEGLSGKGVGKIDYLNPHGTSTPVGDEKEMSAVRAVFGKDAPMISSTKSLTGHSLGAAGAQEAIYCLLMLNNDFACESAHIENLDPAFEDLPILRQRKDRPFTTVMSNSFGFGGTNGALVMSRI